MSKQEIKKILVIRFRRVGDSVLSMSLCASLRKSFPQAEIDFVLNENIASLYEGHPDINRVIPFSDYENHHLPTYLRKVRKLMRDNQYDVIIDMRSTLKTLPFSLFSLSSPYRIGRKKGYTWGAHNYRIPENKKVDRVTGNLELLQPLNKATKVVYDSQFRLAITEKETAQFRAYMEKQGIDFSRPVLLAAVTTRIPGKSWRKEHMTEILKRLISNYDVQVVFNYAGAVETEAAQAYYEALDKHPSIFLNIEAKSLRELCALCQNSTFFFGNEGGPRHIAQAFDVPSFAIYPPKISKALWLPGDGTRFVGISPDEFATPEEQKDMDYAQRFNLLTVEDVWNGLQLQLNSYLTTNR